MNMSQRLDSQMPSLLQRHLAIFSVVLQYLFLCLDVPVSVLVHLFQFFRSYFDWDNGVLFRLDNGGADTIHDIVCTVLCRKQDIEGRPFPLDGVFHTAVLPCSSSLSTLISLSRLRNARIWLPTS